MSRIPDLLSGRWFARDNNRALQFFNISRFSANFLSGWVLVKAGLPIAEISVYETLLFLGNLFTFFWHSGGQNALISFRQIIRELESTQEPLHAPMVLNGDKFGAFANHSLVMANYISRANAAIIDLRFLLQQG